MRISLTAFFCYFLISSVGFPQTNARQLPLESDSAPMGRFELGVNTYFAIDRLFDPSVRAPIELLIRKRMKQQGQMLRFRVYGDLQRLRSAGITIVDLSQNSIYGVSLGYEWLKPINQRWVGYYGVELEGSQNRSFETNTRDGYDPEADPITFWEKTHSYLHTDRIALSPLVGIRISLSKRLLLSTEFRLANYMAWTKSGEEYSTKPMESNEDYQIQTGSEESINERGIRFRPYTGIFLNYRF
nr:hypothetical protein [Cytophagales bacterium]